MRGRSALALGVGAGSLVAGIFLRRRSATRREHVDLYLADGTKLTLAAGTPEFERLAPLARDVLRVAG